MYETADKTRCPVAMFQMFKEKRPTELTNTDPLYLAVIDKPKSDIWYKSNKMGIHTINTMMKSMKINSPLSEASQNKKITNHSARKTTVRKLKSAGIPKCEIKNITGHSTEKGLDAYDSGNEDEMHAMSKVISGTGNNHQSQSLPLHPQVYPQHLQSQISSTTTSNFNFGINWNEPPSASKQPIQNFYFNHCNVTVNNASTCPPKRKRLAIISDSESSQE